VTIDLHPEGLRRILDEFDGLSDRDADPELEAVRIAILLEDVFDILLTDSDIRSHLHGDRTELASFVIRHLPEKP